MERKREKRGDPARGTQPSGRTGHRGNGIPASEVPAQDIADKKGNNKYKHK